MLSSELLYLPAIERVPTGADCLVRIRGLTAADTDRGLAQQVGELARTQDRKFHWLQWAF